MPHASFDGLRVLSLETRRAREVEKLISTYNGDPLVVPSMREIPLSSNTMCLEFGRRLLAGEFDIIIFMTGVGVTKMLEILDSSFDRSQIVEQLRKREIVARGVKPLGALRELQIPVAVTTSEPSTWREVVAQIDKTYGERIGTLSVAVQEYGATNPELLAELVQRCSSVTKIPVYQWGLPIDVEPLQRSIREIIDGSIDVVLFMTAVQVIHLFQVASGMGVVEEMRRAMQSIAIISVGPTTTEEILQYGLKPDFEPSRPRMGFMVNEAAQYARNVLAAKRTPSADSDAQRTFEPPIRVSTNASPPAARSASWPVQQVSLSTPTMAGFRDGLAPLDVLQQVSGSLISSDPLHVVLSRIVACVCSIVPCESCFIYTLEEDKLVLRASRNPHAAEIDQLKISLGQGVSGWVAEYREPVAISEKASDDPRFSAFRSLPEDSFEAMLCVPVLCAGRVVGVLNLQHRQPYVHTELQRRLVATIGVLVGAEIERARLETENLQLSDRLESRKVIDRAKGLLQRDLNLSEDEAYRVMQKESRERRRSMREIADAVLLSENLRAGRLSVATRKGTSTR
ncbi:uroporphyrinogen-III synthase [Granulicella aggregans]|uniref:Uroporphyrinogen-III synthase n=1 Tax=Granulicella aggregans TaxID=474949 RepID=A0A7W7ZF40_9BACT|nr:uroporphyrinogen-III synthase [Granulicella aggregans]MBB5058749.1 uroporphyrinogen-III synthase [Granulicella aggregans]